MTDRHKVAEKFNDNIDHSSILTVLPRPRKIVQDWGTFKKLGPGVEKIRDPWYFFRPLFNQLWENLYLGFGEDGPRSMEVLKVPKQHLYFLSMLLHEALLKEDYVQAAYAMIPILRNPQHVPEQIWKCGLEVQKQCSQRMMTKTMEYGSLMSNLCPQYNSQMTLDMAFYLLKSNNDLLEAYQYLTKCLENKRVKRESLLHAYLGMFEYALWKMDIEKLLLTKKDEPVDNFEADETTEPNDMHYYAKRALGNMKVILEEPGIWDAFVLKIVEVLDYYRQGHEAVALLEAYKEKNKQNPNAHRYLYLFSKKQNATMERLLNILKDLIALDPTSEYAHEYMEMLIEKDLKCDVIDLLFLRLDHVSCKNSYEDWHLLYRIYKACKRDSTSSDLERLKQHLYDRREWWPRYHFNRKKLPLKQIGGDNNTDVMIAKYKKKIEKYFIKSGYKETLRRSRVYDIPNEASTVQDEVVVTSPRKRKNQHDPNEDTNSIKIKRKKN
eukprot:gene11779-12999_t